MSVPRMAKTARAMSSAEMKRKPERVVRSLPGTTKESPSTTRLAMPVAATRVVGPGGIQIWTTAPRTMAPKTSAVVRRASRAAALGAASGGVAGDGGVVLTMDLRAARRRTRHARRIPPDPGVNEGGNMAQTGPYRKGLRWAVAPWRCGRLARPDATPTGENGEGPALPGQGGAGPGGPRRTGAP